MNSGKDQIQWFPGHMAKTRRLISENISKTDIVFELLDARIPISSQNPEIKRLCCNKPILTLLSKSSLADPEANKKWLEYMRSKGRDCLFIDCVTGDGIELIEPSVRSMLSEKIERNNAKGMSGRRLRAMIVGIPNVGKSSLINRFACAKHTKVEDRPGVTLIPQWVSTSMGIDLLDMPGVLWPKFNSKTVGENLAMTGAIRDQILDTEEIAMLLCDRIRTVRPDLLAERYRLSEADGFMEMDCYDLFMLVGKKRGFLMTGGEVNTKRTAEMLLDEFRGGKIGRITLEMPSDYKRERP